jgi:S1-C subfamily serine protease
VEPGSPAQAAGIAAGDTIVDVSGTDARNSDEMIAMLRELKPGQRITVRYRRNGVRDVQVKSAAMPRRYADQARVQFTLHAGDFAAMAPRVGTLMLSVCDELPFAGAQIKPLNADLADALGVQNAGVVVVSVAPGTPAKESGLKSGDVIVKADTVQVESIESIMRAMASASDRSVTLGVMRKGRSQRISLRW